MINVNLTNLHSPVELSRPQLLTSLIPCAIGKMADFYDDPVSATAAAGSLLGSSASDVALTNFSQDLFKLGRHAGIFNRVLTLGSYVFKELAFITDALLGEFGEPNAAMVTLTLAGAPASLPPDGSCLIERIREDLANDSPGFSPANFEIHRGICDGTWALIDREPGGLGHTLRVARSTNDQWRWYTGFPSRFCRSEMLSEGAPSALLGFFNDC